MLIFAVSCNKMKIKKNCCKETATVTPANYNSDSISLIFPNIFTPNGDMINDRLEINKKYITSIDAKVFKRNKLLHSWTDLDGYWDGRSNGKKSRAGMYRYEITLTTINGETLQVESELCLLRTYVEGGDSYDNCVPPTNNIDYAITREGL